MKNSYTDLLKKYDKKIQLTEANNMSLVRKNESLTEKYINYNYGLRENNLETIDLTPVKEK